MTDTTPFAAMRLGQKMSGRPWLTAKGRAAVAAITARELAATAAQTKSPPATN